LFSYDFIGIEIAIGIGIEYLLHVKLDLYHHESSQSEITQKEDQFVFFLIGSFRDFIL